LRNFILSSLLILLLCSCASLRLHPQADVPFVAQRQEVDCGPTCGAMLLTLHGLPFDRDQLDRDMFVPALGGTWLELFCRTLTAHGLSAIPTTKTEASLLADLAAGHPQLVTLAPADADSVAHFAILTGLSPNGKRICLHGPNQPNCWVKTTPLLARWQTAGSTVVAITPRTP
jgi:ABC-type bacteriocin/lantibiotic exporter with double-glycine peptidase domain